MIADALQYAQEQREEHLERLCQCLRKPSVSTLPQYADDVRQAALWVQNLFAEIE